MMTSTEQNEEAEAVEALLECPDDVAIQLSNTAAKDDNKHEYNHRHKHQEQCILYQSLPVYLSNVLTAYTQKARNQLDHYNHLLSARIP
jgi:hypothetical protein